MSNYDQRMAKADEEWLRKLDKDFPNIPPADRAEIHRRRRSFSDQTSLVVCRYVLHQYTAFDLLIGCSNIDPEEISKVHEEARKIMSTWSATEAST